MIENQAGTVAPWEYEWEEQFSFYDVTEPFLKMDVGKVRGLAIAYEESELELAKTKAELTKYREALEKIKNYEALKESLQEDINKIIRLHNGMTYLEDWDSIGVVAERIKLKISAGVGWSNKG